MTETDEYKDTIWEGVPQPKPVIELVKRVAKGDDKARSGIRGCISVYKTIPARRKVVEFLQFVLRKYSYERHETDGGGAGSASAEDEEA